MKDFDRMSKVTNEQTAELLKQLKPEEVAAFYKLKDFDAFIKHAGPLDAEQFAQLAKVAVNDAKAEEDKAKAEELAFAQLPASDKFARRSNGACCALGWGVGIATWATDGTVIGLPTEYGFLLGIGAGCAAYGVSRLLVLAGCEIAKRKDNKSADRPANAAPSSSAPTNGSVGGGPKG